MWKTFQNNGELYMIKITQNEETLEVCVTDLNVIWIQNITRESVLEQFQEMNPLFDIKIEEAVSEVVDLVNHISENVNIEILESPDKFQLTLTSTKSEVGLEFKFNCHKSSSKVFLKEITVPLIQTVKHLEEQQKMLCNLIQRKDRELEEYKLEKGIISRDDLITEKFDENTISNIDNKSMMNIFVSSKSFWDTFVQQHGGIEATVEDVKKDPWNHNNRKRKVYSSKTLTKKGKGINYNETN